MRRSTFWRRQSPAIHSVAEFRVTFVIGNSLARSRVGVEIIVYVDAVDVISVQYVTYDLAYEVTVFLIGGVKKYLSVVTEKTLRMLVGHVS